MARKQATSKSSARQSAGGKTATRKPAARKKVAVRKSPSTGARTAQRAGRSGTAARKKKATRKTASLGRARIPADARLDLVFQKDYQAREVFDFLRVETIRELEQFGPSEILEKLTGPMVQTVQRIRKALALSNRCLAGDQEFAAEFKAEFARR
jgi:hypothetical protein